MITPGELIELNDRWRVIVIVRPETNRRLWSIENRARDGEWRCRAQTGSAPQLRGFVLAWAGAVDPGAAAILDRLPDRFPAMPKVYKRRPPAAPAVVAPIAGAQASPDPAEQAGDVFPLEEQAIQDNPPSTTLDDALAGYWKFHHGIDLRREPRP
jgi:hypothetical protein